MNDAIGISGLCVLTVGLWWIYPPAALVVGGSLLLALGCSGAANERRQKAIAMRFERVKRLKTLGPAAEEFEQDE